MSKELGTLAVVVLKAKNLHDRHSFYKQDPYAKVTLNGKTFKTDADVKGGQHPEWDAEFRFPVYVVKSDSARQLEVACWRAEPREDEEIGRGKVDISDTLKSGEFDDWVTINDVGGTYRGEIYLEMTFFAAGPPSLGRRPSKLPPQERLQHLKYNQAPTAGGSLAVAGAHTHGYSPPRNEKPLPPVQVSQGPAPLPSMLRPGAGPDKANGQGGRLEGYTSPINSGPPSSLFPSRPPASSAHQPNNAGAFNISGQYPPTQPGRRHSSSHSPPRLGNSPTMPSHSPPRQPKLEHNPYVSDPVPPSNPGSSFFPSPHIRVDSTPQDPAPWNPFGSGNNYSPPQPLSQQTLSSYPGGPSFPSVSPQQPPSTFHPTHPTSPPYPPPQSPFSPPQPGYSPSSSTYPPPTQPGYPVHSPSQFPTHQPTYPGHHQCAYPTYGHTSPAPGPGHRPFFGREGSIEELSDPTLMQRYSSPLPLPNDTKLGRSSSPFPVPSVSPSHSTANPYSPSAEYERELQRRREQEERDAALAMQLDYELNLRG